MCKVLKAMVFQRLNRSEESFQLLQEVQAQKPVEYESTLKNMYMTYRNVSRGLASAGGCEQRADSRE